MTNINTLQSRERYSLSDLSDRIISDQRAKPVDINGRKGYGVTLTGQELLYLAGYGIEIIGISPSEGTKFIEQSVKGLRQSTTETAVIVIVLGYKNSTVEEQAYYLDKHNALQCNVYREDRHNDTRDGFQINPNYLLSPDELEAVIEAALSQTL